jgi:hypothetical protein
MSRSLPVDELVDAAEIAARLGVTKQMVHHWRRRNLGFPAPVRELTQVLIWYWPDVATWAESTGRTVVDA